MKLVEEFKVESLGVYAFREFRIEKINRLGFKPLAVPFFIFHSSFFILHSCHSSLNLKL